MVAVRRPDAFPKDGGDTRIMPAVAALRVVNGNAAGNAAPYAQILTPVARSARSQRDESLFFLFSPVRGEVPHICRQLRDIAGDTYWSTPGSVTAALRRSLSVANRHLFEYNLNADRPERCYGGLACAVLRDTDLFLLLAGPVWACIFRRHQLQCFPRGEKLAPVGIGPTPDVRLRHALAAPGDTVLLAPHALLRDVSEEGLRRALSLKDVESVSGALTQIGGDDFSALVARWKPAPGRQSSPTETVALDRRSEGPPSVPGDPPTGHPGGAHPEPDAEPWKDEQEVAEPETRMQQQLRAQRRQAFVEDTRRALTGQLQRGWHHLGSGLSYVWHGVAAAGAGMLALGKWLIGAAGATIRRTLPGSTRSSAHQKQLHPPPPENRTLTMVLAITIPVLILATVLVAYRSFAAESRFQGIINRAKQQIALAQAATADSEETRSHWELAHRYTEQATGLQPEDPAAQSLQDQVQQALDRLDGIQRLTLTSLVDFGSRNPARHLVLADQTVFVLDASEGWVAAVPLYRETGETQDQSSVEQDWPVLVHTGQRVGGDDVGQLIDCTWVTGEGGRQSSALLVLESNGRLVSYDPAWRTESGAPQLTHLELNSPPPGQPVAVGSYSGQFYILDATAEGAGQIWRYRPEGNVYPNQPERYFPTQPVRALDTAIDMTIDGHIYILYGDATVGKFLGGETQGFEIRGVPGDLEDTTGLAVDPDGDGTVYVADRGNARIVALDPEGNFQAQFRVEGALGDLEALAVDQAEARFYVLDGGQLYAASMP